MSASRKKRAARRRREILAAVTASRLDETWERICAWDDARRRSAWMRPVYEAGELTRIELRGGREGDDDVLVIDRTNPQIHEIHNLLCTMRFVVDNSRDRDRLNGGQP